MDDKNLTTPAQNPGAAPAAQDPAKSLDDLLSSLEKEAAQLSGNSVKSPSSLPTSPSVSSSSRGVSSSVPPASPAKPFTSSPPATQTSSTPATAYIMGNKPNIVGSTVSVAPTTAPKPTPAPVGAAAAHTAGSGFNAALEKTTTPKKNIAEDPASLTVTATKTGDKTSVTVNSASSAGGAGKIGKKSVGVGAKIAGLVGLFVLVVGLGFGVLTLQQGGIGDLRQQADQTDCPVGVPCCDVIGGVVFGPGMTACRNQGEVTQYRCVADAGNQYGASWQGETCGTGGTCQGSSCTVPPGGGGGGGGANCGACGGDNQGMCLGDNGSCNPNNFPCDTGLAPNGNGGCSYCPANTYNPATGLCDLGGGGGGGGPQTCNASDVGACQSSCQAAGWGSDCWCAGDGVSAGFCGLAGFQAGLTCNQQFLACYGYNVTFGVCASGGYDSASGSCQAYCTNNQSLDRDDCGVGRPCIYVWTGNTPAQQVELFQDNVGTLSLFGYRSNRPAGGNPNYPVLCPNGIGYNTYGWNGSCFDAAQVSSGVKVRYHCPNQTNLTDGCQQNANPGQICFDAALCGVQQVDVDFADCTNGVRPNGLPCHVSHNRYTACTPTPVPTPSPTATPVATPPPTATPTPITCGNACTGSGQGNCATGLTCDPTSHVCEIPSCVGQSCTCTPPSSPPTCTGLSMTAVGNNVYNLDATAQQGTVGLQKVDFFYRHVVAPITATSCGTSQGTAEYRWILISSDTSPANGWTATWDASALPTGEYQVAANVFDTAGAWCTGNPGCGSRAGTGCVCAAGSVTCSACMDSVTINPPPLVCVGLSTTDVPAYNQPIDFACGVTDGASRYEFRYRVTDAVNTTVILRGWTTIATSPATPNQSVAITPTLGGRYTVQCRPCQGTTCLDWEATDLVQ